MISEGTAPPIPGARYAFSVVHPGSPMLRVRYRQGIVVNGYGFPDWIPYARAVVELPPPAPGRTVDEMRVVDVLVANEVTARTADPLWRSDAAYATPEGWTWAHVAMTRRIALVPAELHGSYRHLGGVATMGVDRGRRGLDVGGAAGVEPTGYQRVSDAALEKIEDHLGYRLPPAYRRFLAATDGGRPHAPAVHPRYGFLADQPFFGVAREDSLQELAYANNWFTDRLTADYLAIGYVQGGLIILKVRGDDADSVWYLDDDDPADRDDYDATSVCAHLLRPCGDDFDAFWAELRAVPYWLRQLAREVAERGDARAVRADGAGAALPKTKRAPS